MEPFEARALLLRQHDDLRCLMVDARRAADRVLDGEPVGAMLAMALAALRRAFAEHNVSEETLLAPILRLDYAWGPPRVARMLEEHAAEHTVFRAMLDGPDPEVARHLADFVEEIDAHMAAEERTFLSAAVLREELVGQASG